MPAGICTTLPTLSVMPDRAVQRRRRTGRNGGRSHPERTEGPGPGQCRRGGVEALRRCQPRHGRLDEGVLRGGHLSARSGAPATAEPVTGLRLAVAHATAGWVESELRRRGFEVTDVAYGQDALISIVSSTKSELEAAVGELTSGTRELVLVGDIWQ